MKEQDVEQRGIRLIVTDKILDSGTHVNPVGREPCEQIQNMDGDVTQVSVPAAGNLLAGIEL